jgi:outer membrane protein OmpA-like peptidoglycan-associated protein
MRPKTNRLLMLLVGAVISGCASQTDRSSSGGGTQTQTEYERVGGSSNAVTKEELERRAAAAAAAAAEPVPAPAPAAAPAPAYEPQSEAVQYVDHPLEETPPPKPAAVAAAPKNEPTPDFPVTKYELPEDQATDEEIEDLGTLDDESESMEQDAAAEAESSVGETTEYADAEDDEEVEDLGTLEDESESMEQEAVAEAESSVGETTEYADADDDEEVGDLGILDDESESMEQEALAAAESSVGETTEYADAGDDEEVEDLGTQPDDSGTRNFAEEKRAAADNVVGEPRIYPDEPAPKATTAAPKSITVNFETEPLFSFDKSTIRADQRTKLDELISGLSGTRYDSILVVGHADRIGKDAYNQKLSERRAAAVKAYLVNQGVPSGKIRTEGRGESESVTGDTCTKTRGKALISCLQPDRRVDVSVSAIKQ